MRRRRLTRLVATIAAVLAVGCDTDVANSSPDGSAPDAGAGPLEEAQSTYPCTGSPTSCGDAGDAEGTAGWSPSTCWPDWPSIAQHGCSQTCSCGPYDVAF